MKKRMEQGVHHAKGKIDSIFREVCTEESG